MRGAILRIEDRGLRIGDRGVERRKGDAFILIPFTLH